MASMDDWKGDLGRTWGDYTEIMDRMLSPFGDAAQEQLGDLCGKGVLDLGCGGGESTVKLAKAVGDNGVAIGVDVSADLIFLANQQRKEAGAANMALMCADASELALGEPVDALYSRFGAMFFDKPIDAFARIRSQMKPGGKASIICWRGFKENPWAFAPFIAAAKFLPEVAPSQPGAPGPFAWAKPNESAIPYLTKSGWKNIRTRPIDHEIVMGAGIEGDPLEAALHFAMKIGPLSSRMEKLPAAQKTKIHDAVRLALKEHLSAGAVRVNGACWLITATA